MSGGRKPKAADAPATTPTAYVVLRAVELDSLGLDDGQRKALGLAGSLVSRLWFPVLNQTAEQGKDGEVRVVVAASKAKAIEAVTGPDGPDILEGSFKAIAVTSWRGGLTTRRTMKSDRLPLDEALG